MVTQLQNLAIPKTANQSVYIVDLYLLNADAGTWLILRCYLHDVCGWNWLICEYLILYYVFLVEKSAH